MTELKLDDYEQYTGALGDWLSGDFDGDEFSIDDVCEEHGEFACSSRACAPPPVGRGGSLPSGGAVGTAPSVEEAFSTSLSSTARAVQKEMGTDQLGLTDVRKRAKRLATEQLTKTLLKDPEFTKWAGRTLDRKFDDDRDAYGYRMYSPMTVVLNSLRHDSLIHFETFKSLDAKGIYTIRQLLTISKRDLREMDYNDKGRPDPYEGMSEHEVLATMVAKEMLNQWADGSNGSPNALAYQIAAGEVHRIDAIKVYRRWGGMLNETMVSTNRTMLETAQDILTRFDGLHEILTRAEYATTQQWFKDHSITEVVVHRGVKMLIEDTTDHSLLDTPREILMNPLSSWATSMAEARTFASNGGSSSSGAMFAMKVPVSMVQSIPLTGRGCLNEDEVILIGFEGSEAIVTDVSGAGRDL